MIRSARYFMFPKPQASTNNLWNSLPPPFLSPQPCPFLFDDVLQVPYQIQDSQASISHVCHSFSFQPPLQKSFSYSWVTDGLFQESMACIQGSLIMCFVRCLTTDIICQTPAFLDSFFSGLSSFTGAWLPCLNPPLKHSCGFPLHKKKMGLGEGGREY